MDDILVPVSPGELIDKITILRIKSERITDPAKLSNVRHELAALQGVADKNIAKDADLERLENALLGVNEDLWQIEDDIREHERRREFGSGFIGLARAVYITNDKRAALKKEINTLLGSEIVEEKSYTDYGADE